MLVAFDATRGPDGKIAVGKWDRICVPTGQPDRKDDMETEFTVETMSQMVDNFVERGDLIPVDWNHQTNYAAQNGQPAPALAWYGALAVVQDGKTVKLGAARGVPESPPTEQLEDGLWGLRTEVTEFGQQLLPNFKYLSPTFTPDGTKRDGSECGYSLLAVAATNSPFQEGTQITFSKPSGANPEAHKESTMKMSPEMLAKLGLAEDASPEECYAALAKHFESADAEKSEMSAKLAKYESDDAEKAKMESDAEMAKLESDKKDDDKDDKKDAAMSTMSASLKAAVSKLEKLEAREIAREKAEQAEREAKYEQLADAAIAGGYAKEKRTALIKFARSDFDAARETVAHLLPRTGAPAHLFDRATKNGGPASPGAGSNTREDADPPAKARTTISMGRKFVEHDAALADKIREYAFSKDPATAAKLDKLIPEPQRALPHMRLLAADKVVRAESPALAALADGE